jgi:hypothetical protein
MSQLRTNSIVPVGGIPAGASGGGIIQVVSSLYTSDFSWTSSSGIDVTGFSASMACASSSSKVLIVCQGSLYSNTSAQEMMMRIRIGASTYTNWVTRSYNAGSGIGGNAVLQHLYSPASTSSITYQVQVMTHTGGTCYMNRDFYGNNNNQSNITLYEISG